MENNEQNESSEKRKESRKFLKIYMITLFAVVISLISLSYFAQGKLNLTIEHLTTVVDSKEKEAISHMTQVEKLQDLSEQQTILISEYKKEVEALKNNSHEYEKIITGYKNFIIIKSLHTEELYEQCVPIAIEIISNGKLETEQMQIEFDEIIGILLDKELITQLQIDESKKLNEE